MYINDYNKWTLRHASFIINGATAYYGSGQAEIDALLGSDIPKQIKLNRSIDLCGIFLQMENIIHVNIVSMNF